MMLVVPLVPFADWDFYYVQGPFLAWEPNPGQSLAAVNVPRGFVSDLASIPRVFWQVLTPQGRYAYAAVVHDYLYWVQTRPRDEADEILKYAMQDSGVDASTVTIIFTAVREFGQTAWDANAKLKKNGECRFLDLSAFPPHLTDTWTTWKRNPRAFTEKTCQAS